MRNSTRLRGQTGQHGFTLIELALSLAILALVLAAVGSAITLAARAVPGSRSAAGQVATASRGADLLASELYYALSAPVVLPNSISFTVAPRGTDTSNETITYSWSGVAGDPLLRKYNSNPAVPVVSNVQDFHLTYNKSSKTTTQSVASTTYSSEVTLNSFSGWPGILNVPISSFNLSSTGWISEYFTNTQAPPPGATALNITRVKLYLSSLNLLPGNITVGIYKPSGGGSPVPTTAAIGTPVALPVSLLGTLFAWTEAQFTDVSTTNFNQDFCVVVKGNSIGTLANTGYLFSTSGLNDIPKMQSSTNGGSTWGPTTNLNQQDMLFQAYGTWTISSNVSTPVTNYYLTSVGIRLKAGSTGSSATSIPPVLTAAEIFTQPQVVGP